ncbi:MAG: hypothetical protein BV458_13665 [Thermoplasmata archaeon M9B2D]|nr:MAG: hypothetical protein BV458_13665 [Thermoplasmata archaeon M9B2D]
MKAQDLYNYIYSHAIPNKALYGAWGKRDGYFVRYIRQNVPKSAKILDASCGRGFLLRWLIADGYDAEGTEIADWLMKPGGDLYGLPVSELAYEELHSIPADCYDVVISNDVIEHLASLDAAKEAVGNLARISKRWVLISTGGEKAAACPFRIELGVSNLHNVIAPYEIWKSIYENFCELDEEYHAAGSRIFLGCKL